MKNDFKLDNLQSHCVLIAQPVRVAGTFNYALLRQNEHVSSRVYLLFLIHRQINSEIEIKSN